MLCKKKTEFFELVQGLDFEVIDSSENSGTKYLLNSDESCERTCISKTFVEIATARRKRGLKTFYIKHNLSHQCKLRRVVEL